MVSHGHLVGRTKREENGEPEPVLECEGNVSNWCENEECHVKCGDGTKLELTCPDNAMSVISNNGKSKVYCGPDAPKIEFPPCFPFCNADPGFLDIPDIPDIPDFRSSSRTPRFEPCFPFCNVKRPVFDKCFPFVLHRFIHRE
eukprot:TRINITY_DN1305_c0_g1_i1.p1 TRINITY_DN1305_c0_g1~~TRINITY_DN1305_c0_g1_i1.p1  ORF type:complete len:143 (-),score=23.68 TRINITY_DN1305_c0_g1_i1:57-485(-)